MKPAFAYWISFVVGGVFVAWLSGRLEPHFVSDSTSYLDYSFSSLDSIGRSIRTPGYPLWLLAFRSIVGLEWVPLAQVIVHAMAASWFAIELRRLGMMHRYSVIAGIAVAVGCTAMDNINIISTDAIAASAGVMVATALLRFSTAADSWRWATATVILSVIAIMLRPAYLFLIPWLLAAGGLLGRVHGQSWKTAIGNAMIVSIATLVPILAWMGLRMVAVNDFGILPFGHQNLAGVLVQLVSDEELETLPGDAAAMGKAIVLKKQKLAATGHTFAAGEAAATMTIDARWDEMTYFVVVPAAKSLAGDDPVAQHNAIKSMNKEIIRQYPRRYILWVAKNGRRGAWAIAADMVMHPIFLAAILCLAAWLIYAATRGIPCSGDLDNARVMRSLTIITLTYLFAKLGFVILTSPGIGRFSDAAAIFLPAWLAVVAVQCSSPRPECKTKAIE
ncbi:membrane protein [Rhodopirellula maiorica SM1]|uniref:Membrane protein n=1 Tax=Rhodopirellula maiorica SM1 TaxID=1265738 RepID=M5RJD1_9BACT|nr:hypothetical protein [Rhodopirellula maiorica]EMI15487.1 membrane protein [Rhodopirellula maiorica SM1]